MTRKKGKPCYRKPGDCIEGDSIRIECRAYGKWKLIQKSGRHKGSICKISKNAKATILKAYTNIQK